MLQTYSYRRSYPQTPFPTPLPHTGTWMNAVAMILHRLHRAFHMQMIMIDVSDGAHIPFSIIRRNMLFISLRMSAMKVYRVYASSC